MRILPLFPHLCLFILAPQARFVRMPRRPAALISPSPVHLRRQQPPRKGRAGNPGES
jgi:hypothetical protein